MSPHPESRQFVRKTDLAALRAAENVATVVDQVDMSHAREMTAAIRHSTQAAALDVQSNPNEAELTLGHLQGLINPLADLLQARGNRPLHKLTITRSQTKPGIGDEDYLVKDINRIGAFMETEKYKQLNSPVKESISTYLREQKQTLRELEAQAAEAEADQTDVIKLAPRHTPDKPPSKIAGFLKRWGLG